MITICCNTLHNSIVHIWVVWTPFIRFSVFSALAAPTLTNTAPIAPAPAMLSSVPLALARTARGPLAQQWLLASSALWSDTWCNTISDCSHLHTSTTPFFLPSTMSSSNSDSDSSQDSSKLPSPVVKRNALSPGKQGKASDEKGLNKSKSG